MPVNCKKKLFQIRQKLSYSGGLIAPHEKSLDENLQQRLYFRDMRPWRSERNFSENHELSKLFVLVVVKENFRLTPELFGTSVLRNVKEFFQTKEVCKIFS